VSELKIDCALATSIITGFLRNEITKFGFERGIVGMSGGVDSTLSAFLTAKALGPDNVTGVIMPYKTSKPDSREHAELAAAQLGIRTEVIDITPQIDAYFARMPDADKLRRANKMARERMAVLYDRSQALRALVIGTSNKTEALLGYTTLWGDMACAINPLGEDKLLFRLVDERKSRDELIEEGFAPEFVARVIQMVQGSQYKRRMPLIAKVSTRSINRDFRYPRDWGR